MKPEIIEMWEGAARELWEQTPELRAQYNFDLGAYLSFMRLRLETQREWQDNPQLQREFAGNFYTFLAYKQAESEGRVIICGG